MAARAGGPAERTTPDGAGCRYRAAGRTEPGPRHRRAVRAGARMALALGAGMAMALASAGPAGAAPPGAAPATVEEEAESSAATVAFEEEATLVPSDGAPGGGFGSATAVSGDTAVVGAGNLDAVEQAYVFTRTGGTWTEQAILTGGIEFGYSVDVSGDTVVVGVPGGFVEESSYVAVFVRTGTTWALQAKLEPEAPDTFDPVGRSVAIDGDTVVSDGYVFVRTGETWSQQAVLPVDDSFFFGDRVALSGDTIVISEDPFAQEQSARVFTRTGTVWTEQAELTPSESSAEAAFGWTVAVNGDTAVIGAPGETVDGVVDKGSAYVFARTGGTWTEQARLTGTDPATGDSFGLSVDVDGDTVMIGSPNDETAPGIYAGATYAFARSGTTWDQTQKLAPSDAAARFFGASVALAGETALIGASQEAFVFVATPVGPGIVIHGGATATGGGRAVSLTATITCAAGSRFDVTATVRQGRVSGTGRASGMCTGGPRTITVTARAAAGGRFGAGPAQACAMAKVGPTTAEACRVVTIAGP